MKIIERSEEDKKIDPEILLSYKLGISVNKLRKVRKQNKKEAELLKRGVSTSHSDPIYGQIGLIDNMQKALRRAFRENH